MERYLSDRAVYDVHAHTYVIFIFVNLQNPYKKFARKQAITNSKLMTAAGAKPFINVPGKIELLVGRPKKYLRGPALVIPQDTNSDPIVDRMSTTGKDPGNRFVSREVTAEVEDSLRYG